MISLTPHSRLQTHQCPAWTATGAAARVVVIKSSFEYSAEDGTVQPLPQSEPLILADEYADSPKRCAPDSANEAVPFKQGAEILLYAHAYSEQPRGHFPVSAELTTDTQHWCKKLIVLGPRVWKKTLLGSQYTDPESLTELPIRYEYAYGGAHPSRETDVCPSNPVGRGYAARARATGCPLPQIEWPDQILSKPTQSTRPAGFGPLPLHWSPRAERFPAIDEQKLDDGDFPYLADLPETAFHAAPEDQWLAQPLTGPACLTLTGLTRNRPANQPLELHWQIPELTMRFQTRLSTERHRLQADTLIVDTRSQRIHLLYRHAFTGLPERTQAHITVSEPEVTN